MIADRPLPADLDARLDRQVREWAEDPEIAAVYLFGSRARGNPSARSDVDLAVVLAAGLDPAARWCRGLELLAQATASLGTDAVDLVVVEDAPSLLGHRILRDGRLLLENDPSRRIQVVEMVLRRYFDTTPLRASLERGLKERLREGRFAG